MNLVTAARHDSVSKDSANSMCTTLVVRQVKMQHNLFKVLEGIQLRSVRSSRRRYEWMGTHVHQVVLGVGLPSVDESGWRFCDCIWYISTWFSLIHFLLQWSSTPFQARFPHILCPHVVCHDVLSPTEVVQLDVLVLTKLGVLLCNQGLNASVGLSL